ncbi:toprim domain-containing protein [Dactylosporangium sucinum]|uniref:Toprim domain-containing protein n=1 Tax=Dactylosporangium sucinum TaxID=1424081 RepID=A0A917WRS6_9ACTN|nr:toprim domain-containing protein [Dactylosporangium sucinum]GGM24109.1 hypothetical protein GCM10007977_026580 [Dactylosporangium sucinum]
MAATVPTRPAVSDVGADVRRLLAANDAAVAFFRAQLVGADGPRRYLQQRGLGVLAEREWPWRVGYAPPGWNLLTRHLTAAGFSADELVTAGLSARTHDDPDRLIDVFRDRIVFPIRSPSGHVVAFIGRASPAAVRNKPDTPKYINTHASPIYDKDQLLFGIAEQHDRLRAGWTPVLVEGPADTIAVWLSYSRSGTHGAVAVAPCGTAFGAVQADMLRAMPGAARGVVVAFDGDTAGQAAADAAFELLRHPAPARPLPGPLLAAEFAAGADPADLLTRPNGRAQLRAALQRQTRPLALAVADHQLNRILAKHPRALEDIAGRHTVARAVAPRVFGAVDTAEAARIARHIARRAGVGLPTVVDAAVEHLQDTVTQLGAGPAQRLPTPPTGRPPPPAAAAAFPRLQQRVATGSPAGSGPSAFLPGVTPHAAGAANRVFRGH